MRVLLLLYVWVSLATAQQTLRDKALSKGLRSMPTTFETLKAQVDDADNPLSISKVLLGKQLFFDANLSKDRSISCASCHDLNKGGDDDKPTAVGYHNLSNPSHLNSPTVFNTSYSKHFFWDGRASSLHEQAKGPIQAPFEMASTPELVVERVRENPRYRQQFQRVFPTRGIRFDTVTKAIAAYEKTLITRSRYDDFLDGNETALTPQEQRGLNLFIDMGCKGCHFGPSVGGQRIQKFPLRDYNSIINLTTTFNENTKGRSISHIGLNFKMYHPFPFENKGGFMGNRGERNFRVPILRNIADTAPYFHNGAIKTLREAITIMSKHQIGVELSKEQLDALEAFLKSLSGTLVDLHLNR
ncbi:MAG: cytochrome-c peroxidase [Sulfurimonas sp.]|nr:MAG: cytochrome-c peroxidase [Sulfurimonas sp.]